jgi:hypothetical protein
MDSATLRPLYPPEKRSSVHCTEGGMGFVATRDFEPRALEQAASP